MPKMMGFDRATDRYRATRFTVVTLMPFAPPAPIRIPLTDMPLSDERIEPRQDELERRRAVAEGTAGILRPTPARSIRSGAVALVSTQSLPLFEQTADHCGRACSPAARRGPPSE